MQARPWISDSRLAERLSMQYAVTRGLAEAGTVEEAMPRVLQGICETLDWDYGAFWAVDDEAEALRCIAVWHAPSANLWEFEALSRRTTFRRRVGLPGRVWDAASPVWISDVVSDPNFPRAPAAARHELHSGCAFPVVLYTDVLGVMEFFSRRARPPDEELLRAMAAIGSQAGQFIERKEAEQAVRASEARHAAILEAALDCVITIDHEGTILEFNPAAERTFGHLRWQAVGREMAELIVPPAYRDAHRRGLARYLETGDGPVLGRRIEITGLRADATEFPVELAITRVAVDGPPVFTGYLRDITERKLAEQSLRESQAELDAVIRAMAEAVVVVAPDGRVTLTNAAADALFDGRRVESYAEVTRRLETDTGSPPDLAASSGGAPVEVRLKDDGRWLELNAYAAVVPRETPGATESGNGHARDLSTILVLRDVTEAKQAQAARDAFLGVLSHELRTPITTIYAASEVLSRQDRELPEETRRELYEDIKAESQRLERLVEDLLVLTRFERGAMEIGLEPVLVQRVAPAVVAAEQSRWPETEFVVRVPPHVPTVQGETTYIEQVVRNLVANAAKYSPPGTRVEVCVEEAEGEVQVRVLDQGPGIAANEAPRLFELFYRSEATAAHVKGAGIGLFVSKQLIEAMGGRIWARPRPDGGAEFGFALRPLGPEFE